MADPLPPPQHPFRLINVPAGRWFRVHAWDASTGRYAPTAFNDSGLGNARFSPLLFPLTHPRSGQPVPTLYAAADARGALAEIVLHDVPTPSTGYLHDLERDLTGTLHLSRITLPALKLANLTSAGLKAAGLAPHELFAGDQPDYPRTRAWAAWIWQQLPAAQGLTWMSRRDNRCQVLMLFGDRLPAEALQDGGDSRPLARCEDLIVALLDEMGAGVIPKL